MSSGIDYDEPWIDASAPYFCGYFRPVVSDAIQQYDYAWPVGSEGPAHIITQDGNIEDHCLDFCEAEVEGDDSLRAASVRWLVERIRSVPESERVVDKSAWPSCP